MSRPATILFVLLASFALAGTGCLRPSPSDRPALSVSPAVLDFGKVRPTDSPVRLAFDICNDGRESIVVTEIVSGCGCTIVDIPKEPIPVGGKVSVTVQVNFLGRFGLFENELIIKTTTEPLVKIAIRGKIETDIWTDGQALRCTVGPIEQYASTVLTIYTTKYPEIVFADTTQEDGVILQEISRTTKDGKTAIRFFIEVKIDRNSASITKNINIVPADTSISPLIIPLYCYREDKQM